MNIHVEFFDSIFFRIQVLREWSEERRTSESQARRSETETRRVNHISARSGAEGSKYLGLIPSETSAITRFSEE